MPHHAIDLEAQFPTRTISHTSTLAPANTGLQANQQPQWAVVVQRLDDSATLHNIPVDHAETGEQVWSRIREHVRTTSITTYVTTWLLAFFTKTIVGTAKMRQVGTVYASLIITNRQE